MKQCKVYGMLAAAPIDFPDEIELRVYPHDKETGLGYGGFYSYTERRSWQWMQSFIPLVPHAWADIEQKMMEGGCVPLGLGEHSIDLPDEVEGPGIVKEA